MRLRLSLAMVATIALAGCAAGSGGFDFSQARVVQTNSVYFGKGSFELSTSARSLIDALYEQGSAMPNSGYLLHGHTDTVGSDSDNLKLSRDMAEMVAGYLVSKGVDPDKIEIEAFGERQPTRPTADETADPLNRRVEFKIVEFPQ